MTAVRRRRLITAAVAGFVVLTAAGCGGTAAGPAVTVTDLTTVAPPTSTPPPQTTVSTLDGQPSAPSSVQTSPSQTPPATTVKTSTATSTKPSSKPTGPVVGVTGDPDAPGQDNGPVCAADKRYSDESPAGLHPDVIAAWTAVKAKAKAAGVALCLNDGKRSRAQQLKTYQEYVEKYGKAMADELVLQPEKSAHVAGYAVDVQPANGYLWLEGTDGKYGFCRTYDNEAWHFEYTRQYLTAGCPPRLPKPER